MYNMKKLLTLTFAILLSLSAFGGHRMNPKVVDKHVTDWGLDQLRDMGYTIHPEVIVQDILNRSKQSNYEKYWESKNGKVEKLKGLPKPEFDDLYFNPKTDQPRVKHQRRNNLEQIVDTLVQENPNITVNVYDLDPFYYSNRIGRFYYGGFNRMMYSCPWYYNSWMYEDYGWGWNPYYGYNYPYYNDFYFGFNTFGYTTFGHYWEPFPDWNFGFGYYGYNHYGYNNWNHHNYYGNNSGNYQNKTNYGRIERPSTMSSQRRTDTKQNYNQSDRNRNTSPQSRSTYSENRRSYTPSYNRPRMNTIPVYNNSHIENRRVMPNSISESRTQNRTYSQPNNTQRSSVSRTQNRTYSTPSMNRNYSQPSNNHNTNRSSNYSQPSNSYNSGGRRSNSESFNSGGSSNSGGGSSNSGGGSIRSSGGRGSITGSGRR